MRSGITRILTVAGLLHIALVPALWSEGTTTTGSFSPTWESLKSHHDPEWFRDAKLGIYTHWGPVTVGCEDCPKGGQWYGGEMYNPKSPVFAFHKQRFGDQAKVGYKDVIPLFKPEKFDAEAWADLFTQAGAKFAGPVAAHHDNFAMWDSAAIREVPINTSASASARSPERSVWPEHLQEVRGDIRRKADLRGKETQKAKSAQDPLLPVTGYQRRTIEGWTVFVSDALLRNENEATSRALDLLQKQLAEIVGVLPAPAVARLRTVPLWFSPAYPGARPTAEYHPAVGWLRSHGRNPAMAKAIEFTNVRTFAEETRRMPVFVLHELAHSYHDQVLGFDNPEVKAAYRRAVESKSYDAVERTFGSPAKKNTTERAYAMTNAQEYFAEITEAFFGRNDFYPFNRAELQKHDPEMYRLLQRLWQCDDAGDSSVESAGRP